ncbi:hypothetical protein D3C76_851680 [compost metagenome]
MKRGDDLACQRCFHIDQVGVLAVGTLSWFADECALVPGLDDLAGRGYRRSGRAWRWIDQSLVAQQIREAVHRELVKPVHPLTHLFKSPWEDLLRVLGDKIEKTLVDDLELFCQIVHGINPRAELMQAFVRTQVQGALDVQGGIVDQFSHRQSRVRQGFGRARLEAQLLAQGDLQQFEVIEFEGWKFRLVDATDFNGLFAQQAEFFEARLGEFDLVDEALCQIGHFFKRTGTLG